MFFVCLVLCRLLFIKHNLTISKNNNLKYPIYYIRNNSVSKNVNSIKFIHYSYVWCWTVVLIKASCLTLRIFKLMWHKSWKKIMNVLWLSVLITCVFAEFTTDKYNKAENEVFSEETQTPTEISATTPNSCSERKI